MLSVETVIKLLQNIVYLILLEISDPGLSAGEEGEAPLDDLSQSTEVHGVRTLPVKEPEHPPEDPWQTVEQGEILQH